MVIMLTTIVPPPILNFLLQRKDRKNAQKPNVLSSIGAAPWEIGEDGQDPQGS